MSRNGTGPQLEFAKSTWPRHAALVMIVTAQPFDLHAADAAGADQHPAAGAQGLEEVMVTAQRREQSLMDVPLSIQALSGADLTEAGAINLRDVIKLIPGASVAGDLGPGNQVYQLRGVVPSEFSGDAAIGFYLDEFAFSIPSRPYAPSANLYDLARVEVVRGPSGTLYGLGSLGGTLKVITNAPELNQAEASARASGSSTSEGSANGTGDIMVNVPLVEDVAAVRGVLSYDHRGGYADAPALNRKDVNSSDSLLGRIKLLVRPTEDLEVTLGYWRARIDQDFYNRLQEYDPPTMNDVGFGSSPVRYSLYSADVTYDFGFATLLSASGYMDQELDHTNNTRIDGLGNVTVSIPNPSHSFVQDLRLTSNDDGAIKYLVGAFYRKGTLGGGINIAAPEAGFGQHTDDKLTSESWALYGEGTLSLLEGRLDLTLGGRYFEERKVLEQNNAIVLTGPPVMVIPTTGALRGTGDTFNPHFNVSYRPVAGGMVYVDVAKGFRSGVLQPQSAVDLTRALTGLDSSTSLPPDTLWNYELGTKWQLLDNQVNLDLAVYRFDWKDAQLETYPSGTALLLTAGDVRAYGVDAGISALTPIDGLRVQAVANFNETQLRDVPPGLTAVTPWVADGEQLPGAPKRTYSANLDYIRPVGSSGFDLNLSARYSHRAEIQILGEPYTAPSFGTTDLRIGLVGARFNVALFANNVSDTRGPISRVGFKYLVPYPREIGLALEMKL